MKKVNIVFLFHCMWHCLEIKYLLEEYVKDMNEY